MINTATMLPLLLASGTVKLGLNAGVNSMLLVGFGWVGPCVGIEDNEKAILLKANYVYFSAAAPLVYGLGPGGTSSGHGGGLCLEVIPHISTRATIGDHGCIRGCLGVDPYWGLSRSLIRRTNPDSSRSWDLWGWAM